MHIYQVDLKDVANAFPDPAAIPPLLQRFGAWLAGKPWRSVGAFDLSPEWCDSYFPGSQFQYDQFALFIRLPDGSSAGYWLDGRSPAGAPIVVLGSEGEFQTLAPDLETLLARIALGDFDEKGPSADFLYSEEDYAGDGVPDLRHDLQSFLRDAAGVQDIAALARKATQPARDFGGWVTTTSEAYEAEVAAHPAILAMAPCVDRYRPVDAPDWSSTRINIAWAGENFEASLVAGGQKPFDEAQQLRPHLAVLRDEATIRKPGLGLWHSATLLVFKDRLYLQTYYSGEPDFRQGKPQAGAYKADQSRMPREARRIPRWLAAILAS